MKQIERLLALRSSGSRVDRTQERQFTKVGVAGAGLMGSGIATVCARAGLDVVLVDRTDDVANAGRDRIVSRERNAAERGLVSADVAAAVGGRIHPTSKMSELAGVDLVIEAVFEDRAVKANVTRSIEAIIPPNTIFATNTSTLPISGLAEVSKRPGQFVGMHFFSPVDRMPLLEIICGRETHEQTLQDALQFAELIGKIPISVNDGRGFYTTRIVIAYIREANELLADGVPPELIEQAAIEFGMPLGPLALCDEVALSLMHQINEQAKKDLGTAYEETKGGAFLRRMVETERRVGRKCGKGYYDYPSDAGKKLWPGLRDLMPRPVQRPPAETVQQRLAISQTLEAVRALEEAVLTSPIDGDIGALLGWGFPESVGGPFSYVDRVGPSNFIGLCLDLEVYGTRFRPPNLLHEIARDGRLFYSKAFLTECSNIDH